MKKAFMYFLGGLGALVGILLIVASLQPAQWHIERSATINAPREIVWRWVADIRRFDEWSPYARRDPNMKKTVTGTPGTAGQMSTWDGNGDVGAGRMIYVNVIPNDRVDVKLEMLRPFAATNDVAFILVDAGGNTRMTWAMDGRYEGLSGLMGKMLGLLINMDKMVGGDFDAGLASLKDLAEKEPR